MLLYVGRVRQKHPSYYHGATDEQTCRVATARIAGRVVCSSSLHETAGSSNNGTAREEHDPSALEPGLFPRPSQPSHRLVSDVMAKKPSLSAIL
jgi:hypothetical protein